MFSSPLKQKGFTLIEAMLASSIFIFGFIATNRAQVSLLKASQESVQQGQASKISTNRTEELRAYSSLAAYQNLAGGSYTTNGMNASFLNTVTLGTQNRYKQVSQTITWTNSSGQTKSLIMTNYISQNDPQSTGLLFSSSLNGTPLPIPGSDVTSLDLAPYTQLTTPVDNAMTTATVPETGNVITYDDNLNPSLINGVAAVSLRGVISLATGTSVPPVGVNLSSITLIPNTTNIMVADCSYQAVSGNFNCTLGHSWSGSILLAGVSSVKVCTVYQQPYVNLLQSIINQDYLLINVLSDCPANYPHLLQTL